MTTDPQTRSLRAVLTVTVETKPDGDYYVDHADFVRHVVPWIEGGLEDRDDIRKVTITEQPASADRAAVYRQLADWYERTVADAIPGQAPDWYEAIGDVIRGLRRMADEEQQPETQAPHPPETFWQIETQWHTGDWRSWALRTEHDEALREFEGVKDGKHAWRLVRFHTTTAIEAEHEPAAAPQPGKEA